MTKKILFSLVIAVSALGAVSSFGQVQRFLIEVYDLVTHKKAGVLGGAEIAVKGRWILADFSDKDLSFLTAGLFDEDVGFVTVFSKDKIINPCGRAGREIQVVDYDVLVCVWNTPKAMA